MELAAQLAARLDLGATGTPLEELPRLRAALGDGAPRLWIKRDDLMGRGLGGNKLRKLEFLLAEARAQGATAVGSIGGPTSNHLRLVAAAARWLGLSPHAFVIGDPSPAQGGNLRLLELLGAACVGLPAGGSVLEAAERARGEFLARCAADGERGYWIPLGGSTEIGHLGYLLAARELAEQLAARDVSPRAIYLAVGTGGTAAGLAAGATRWLPGCEVVGVAVTAKGAQVFSGLPSLPKQIGAVRERLAGEGPLGEVRFRFDHGQLGAGYAAVTAAATEAIELLARSEALFVDPVYTGKALAGLIADVRAGRYQREDHLVFLHTGGWPGLLFRAA